MQNFCWLLYEILSCFQSGQQVHSYGRTIWQSSLEQYEPDDSNLLISYVWDMVPRLAWSWLRASRCTLWTKPTEWFIYRVCTTSFLLLQIFLFLFITQGGGSQKHRQQRFFWRVQSLMPHILQRLLPIKFDPVPSFMWTLLNQVTELKLLSCFFFLWKVAIRNLTDFSYLKHVLLSTFVLQTKLCWNTYCGIRWERWLSACFWCKTIFILPMSDKQLYVGFVLQTPSLFEFISSIYTALCQLKTVKPPRGFQLLYILTTACIRLIPAENSLCSYQTTEKLILLYVYKWNRYINIYILVSTKLFFQGKEKPLGQIHIWIVSLISTEQSCI